MGKKTKNKKKLARAGIPQRVEPEKQALREEMLREVLPPGGIPQRVEPEEEAEGEAEVLPPGAIVPAEIIKGFPAIWNCFLLPNAVSEHADTLSEAERIVFLRPYVGDDTMARVLASAECFRRVAAGWEEKGVTGDRGRDAAHRVAMTACEWVGACLGEKMEWLLEPERGERDIEVGGLLKGDESWTGSMDEVWKVIIYVCNAQLLALHTLRYEQNEHDAQGNHKIYELTLWPRTWAPTLPGPPPVPSEVVAVTALADRRIVLGIVADKMEFVSEVARGNATLAFGGEEVVEAARAARGFADLALRQHQLGSPAEEAAALEEARSQLKRVSAMADVAKAMKSATELNERAGMGASPERMGAITAQLLAHGLKEYCLGFDK